MWHIKVLEDFQRNGGGQAASLTTKATGRYYTDERIAHELSRAVWAACGERNNLTEKFSVVDPFCGDGRLVRHLLESAIVSNAVLSHIEVALWDLDEQAVQTAQAAIESFGKSNRLNISVKAQVWDTFVEAAGISSKYNIVITNPPWEVLKPDPRDLSELSEEAQERYIERLRAYDAKLATIYPLSQPKRKFAGWGTNLARVGLEAALNLTTPAGVVGIVSPASVLADEVSARLRAWMSKEKTLIAANYYPAEARLFGKADIDSCTLILGNWKAAPSAIKVKRFDRELNLVEDAVVPSTTCSVDNGYSLPLKLGVRGIKLQAEFKSLPKFGDLEGKGSTFLWAGRELDESNLHTKLLPSGTHLFLKGRMIERYNLVERPSEYVRPELCTYPSARMERICWRDVARSSQDRRMKATLMPPGWISGNSVNVAHFRDGNQYRLKALLAVMNSAVFEWQLRSVLSTGHISLSSVRKVSIPVIGVCELFDEVVALVDRCLNADRANEARLEALIAHAYGLNGEQLGLILQDLPGIGSNEATKITAEHSNVYQLDRIASDHAYQPSFL